jgi:protein gp37
MFVAEYILTLLVIYARIEYKKVCSKYNGVSLMSLQSAIEWTDATWNPVTGCTEVSPGCDHCYAKTFAERWRGTKDHPYEQGFDLKLWPARLEYPLLWKKPRRIFTNSMSDLFHKDVPDDFILQVFGVMARANWHNFQVLTKRPSRLLRLAPKITQSLKAFTSQAHPWPAHIWLGVSIETIQYAWRVEQLRRVPAAIRFISAEPLLGSLEDLNLADIHWVIAGGESGPRHRPCDPAWIRGLRDKCQALQIAFFFKQWGGRSPKSHGRLLDGSTWNEYPQQLPTQQEEMVIG